MSDVEIGFLDFFQDLEDPRIDRKKLYSIEEILLTTLCAVIAEAEGWQDVKRDIVKCCIPSLLVHP
ncbi:MAG: hypothetical protein A3F40_03825 [Chlamydiae bacterium RIFCSPHIGHO2_12_FULL_27_8]|nr:MAG: hypothetical protein A3F40_03825 [Chlamydiae bacterium RIFCSPHIGHO2_12_FULL_27_8]OGN65504.1 MAG: hypothetical protein A2888_01510 [Chlamydiae bacterium RIFCSPLOWO2_01_FULL_28_7]